MAQNSVVETPDVYGIGKEICEKRKNTFAILEQIFTMSVALITGASKGIGRSLAQLLAAKGFSLSLVARTGSLLESLLDELSTSGASVKGFVGDVSDESFVQEVVAQTILVFGQIDFLINNAGSGQFGPVDSYTSESWDQMFDTNVKGTFLFTQQAIPHMRSAGKGHILNIASDVAKRTFDGGSAYCATKYAQHAFSEAVRKEVRKDGIKVSVVYSGLVDTMFHAEPQGDASHADWLTGEDMARSIHFIMDQPPHVVIDELMIHPLSQPY